jgi:hypothetical protein
LGNGRGPLAQGNNKILGRKGFRQVLAYYFTAAGHVPISMRKSITKSMNRKFSGFDINKMVSSVRTEITVSKHEINFQFWASGSEVIWNGIKFASKTNSIGRVTIRIPVSNQIKQLKA